MMQKSTIAVTAVLAVSLAFVAVVLTSGADFRRRTGPVPAANTTPAATAVPAATAHALAAGLGNFVRAATPAAAPAVQFLDGDGKPLDFTAFQGKVVLVNLWATWCAPCRAEMPALDGLQAALGGKDFAVVAISQDSGAAADKVRQFWRQVGVSHLVLYTDPTMATARAFRAVGLPTSFLIGRDGKEIGRLIGPAQWDSAEAQALIKAALAKAPLG